MTALWQRNCRALAHRPDLEAQGLAAQLVEMGPGRDLGLRNQAGSVLPGFVHDRPRALISGYDAGKEAERWAQDVSGGTVALWGAGGTAALEVLLRRGVRLAFWVEPRLEVWQSLLTWEDWTPWLGHQEWVPVWGDPSAWDRCLRSRYHPLWDGSFRTLEWRSAVQGLTELWDERRETTRRVLDDLTADASTQARFGERWYRNTLANLKRLKAGSVPPCPGATVVVAGAGPGLDDALDDPAQRRWLDTRSTTGDRLFATDTALPALSARGIVPDLVFCLDGQLPSYHHFVSTPPEVTLIADLASIPLLGRLPMPQIRFLSGHPFATIIRRWFPDLPVLDGSLGNVSGLAQTTAKALGARRVDVWGVGFSYRNGQAYARGTYVYELAGRRASRVTPWESLLSSSCYGAKGLERTWDEAGRALDTTERLRDYRRRWDRAPSTVPPVSLDHQAAGPRWEAFAAWWKQSLLNLPLPARGAPVHPFVLALDNEPKSHWWALWPLALALHRQGVPDLDLPQTVVERALSFLQD